MSRNQRQDGSNGSQPFVHAPGQIDPKTPLLQNLALSDGERPATKKERYSYYAAKGSILFSFGGELAYAGFTVQDASGGLYALGQNMFDYPEPYTPGEDGNNPDTQWTRLPYVLPATTFAVLDYGMNITVMDPTGDALGALNLAWKNDQLIAKPGVVHRDSKNVKVALNIATVIAFHNFTAGSLTDLIAPNTFGEKVGLSPAGNKALTWALGGPLSLSGIAYYYFLTFNNIKDHVREYAKGRDSMFAELWRLNKSMSIMANSKALVTDGYRAITFSLITNQFLKQVIKYEGVLLNPLSGVSAATSFIISFLSRHMNPTQKYLAPFKITDAHEVESYQHDLFSPEEREAYWKDLQSNERAWAAIPALFLGLIRSLPIFYLTYAYMGDAINGKTGIDALEIFLKTLTSCIPSGMIFGHALITDLTDAKNALYRASNDGQQKARAAGHSAAAEKGKEITPCAKGTAVVLNAGSQMGRWLIGLASATLLNDGTFGFEMPLDRGTMLLLWVGGEVAWTQFLFYAPKMTGPVQNRLNDLSDLFRCSSERVHAAQAGSYQRLGDDPVMDTANLIL